MAGAGELIAYLDGLADELREKGAKALAEFDRDDMHDARVASRRLGVAVEVLGPLAGKKGRKAIEKALKKARHRLGEHRDLDVMLGWLEELGADGRFSAGAGVLSEALLDRREALREEAASEVPELKQWGSWKDDIAVHAEGVRTVVSEAVHDKLDEVVRLAGSLASPHPLRVAAKELRYALELAGEVGMWENEVLLGKFKGLQDVLGAWHDFGMVADAAMRLARRRGMAFRAERDGLNLAELAAECLHRAQWKLGEFRADWAREGPWIEQGVRAGFPLVDDVTGEGGSGAGAGGAAMVTPADVSAADPAASEPSSQDVAP